MTLKGASQVKNDSADWLDWDDLVGAAVVCTAKKIEPPHDYGNGEVEAVVADVIVLTGAHAGEIHRSERILKAGIRSKLQEIGSSVVGRVGVYGKRRAIGLEAEHDGDLDLAERALAKFAASAGNGNGKATAKNTAATTGSDDDPPF